MDAAAVVLGYKLTTSDLSRISMLRSQRVPGHIRRRKLKSQKRDSGARAPTSFVAHLVAGLLAAPHDPWAARLSSTKQVGRPFLGSINALPAVAETMRARAEVILAATPAVGQRLGRALHHRVVATVTVRAHSRDR